MTFDPSHCKQTVHIKFLTEADRVRGFYELARRIGIGSLPGQVYQVRREALQILADLQIGYRDASESEVKDAHDQVRNPSPALL